MSSIIDSSQKDDVTKAPAKSLHDLITNAEPAERLKIVLEAAQKIVASTLGFESFVEIDVNRSLKDVGIDSLTAVQLRNRLATATRLPLSVNIAFAHPSLRALSQALCDQMQSLGPDASPRSPSTLPPDSLQMSSISAGCLDETFNFTSDGSKERPRSAFLTGATGFVGAFILKELVKEGIVTYCLVRASSIGEATQRLLDALRHYGLFDYADRALIKPLVGDISQPLLGLSVQVFDELADRIDAICHSAGLVQWTRPFEDYIGPNIVSTHEILRLASRGRPKAIHLVSTISTLPKHMGLEFNEKELEYGYGTSKFLAERLVAAARWRDALATIYRLPYVTASSASGHFRHDQGDFLHNLIIGCRQLGSFPYIDTDLRSVLPVDYVAKTIVSLMTNDRDNQGKDYDFWNANAPSCEDFFNAIIALDGNSAPLLPFDEWKKKVLAVAADKPGGPLAKIAVVVDGYTAVTAHEILKGQKLGQNVLGAAIYPTPLMDEQFAAKYVSQIRSS